MSFLKTNISGLSVSQYNGTIQVINLCNFLCEAIFDTETDSGCVYSSVSGYLKPNQANSFMEWVNLVQEILGFTITVGDLA